MDFRWQRLSVRIHNVGAASESASEGHLSLWVSRIRTIKRTSLHLWIGLREWCGDSAYDRYVQARQVGAESPLLTRGEFYVERLNERYSRPTRCC